MYTVPTNLQRFLERFLEWFLQFVRQFLHPLQAMDRLALPHGAKEIFLGAVLSFYSL